MARRESIRLAQLSAFTFLPFWMAPNNEKSTQNKAVASDLGMHRNGLSEIVQMPPKCMDQLVG